MPNCHEMKNGDIYKCEDCDMEIQVIKECKDYGTPADTCTCACACATAKNLCNLSCCGKDMEKKA